jgi:DNA-binding MarR family transcriptional regulator
MPPKIKEQEYKALAELRFRIRRFLQEGDNTAHEAGLEAQQYLLLLAIRGLPEGHEATISKLAERLLLRHHSTVELIDRLETQGYVKRVRGREDRRQVLVVLQPRGEKLLEKVVAQRLIELRSHGRALVGAISSILESRGRTVGTSRRSQGSPQKPGKRAAVRKAVN